MFSLFNLSKLFSMNFKNLFFWALASFSVISCDDESETVDQSKVMIVHASPDAPAVDLLLNNTKVAGGVNFLQNTNYLEVNSGVLNVKVNAAGTSTSVINADLNVSKDKSYSVFAVDKLASISAVAFEDDLTTPATGKAHVRFIHLSPDAPAVDIALRGGAALFPNVGFKSGTAFTPVNAGTVQLDVRLAGTQTVALGLADISLEAGKIYTIYAKGLLTGTGNQALGAQIIVNK